MKSTSFYIPQVGDKITLSDKQLQDQALSVPIIKAIGRNGYCTVIEVERLPYSDNRPLFVVTVLEDTAMTIVDFDKYRPGIITRMQNLDNY